MVEKWCAVGCFKTLFEKLNGFQAHWFIWKFGGLCIKSSSLSFHSRNILYILFWKNRQVNDLAVHFVSNLSAQDEHGRKPISCENACT